jgi:hypothetical protein
MRGLRKLGQGDKKLTIARQMLNPRWYPTATTLADGQVRGRRAWQHARRRRPGWVLPSTPRGMLLAGSASPALCRTAAITKPARLPPAPPWPGPDHGRHHVARLRHQEQPHLRAVGPGQQQPHLRQPAPQLRARRQGHLLPLQLRDALGGLLLLLRLHRHHHGRLQRLSQGLAAAAAQGSQRAAHRVPQHGDRGAAAAQEQGQLHRRDHELWWVAAGAADSPALPAACWGLGWLLLLLPGCCRRQQPSGSGRASRRCRAAPAGGQYTGATFTSTAADISLRIKVQQDPATRAYKFSDWLVERMPYGRVMSDAVLLPNGRIIILNGAKVRQALGRPAEVVPAVPAARTALAQAAGRGTPTPPACPPPPASAARHGRGLCHRRHRQGQ